MTKTTDETKKGLECCKFHYGDMYTDCSHCPYYLTSAQCDLDMHDDALALIQQLEAKVPRWISVKEKLPEEGQKVVFIPTCNHGSLYVGVISNIGKSGGVMFLHREGRYKSNYYARYWMPLPEPPKEPEA